MRTIEAMRVSGFGVLACISGIACSSGIESSATSNDNLRMTGQPIDPTANLQQAETGINVSFLGTSSVVSVVYNDFTNEVPAFIIYPPGNRQILPGASLAGWSVSTDGGGSFHYGGKLTPPAGWDVLWGDPSVTGSRLDHHYAYMSSLAVPHWKYPVPGPITGPINAFLGGACIGRSTDGGATYTAAAADCLTRNGDFYDGGSMVTDNSGNVYASFVDVTTNSIDVWRAPGDGTPFALLPSQPFYAGTPFAKVIFSHPRLRYDVFNGYLYAMALGGPGVSLPGPGGGGSDDLETLYIDWWNGTSWAGPRLSQASRSCSLTFNVETCLVPRPPCGRQDRFHSMSVEPASTTMTTFASRTQHAIPLGSDRLVATLRQCGVTKIRSLFMR